MTSAGSRAPKINQRIVVTGANGFVGRYVVSALQHRNANQVIPWVRARDGDLLADSPIEALRLHKPDVVVHLAWSTTKRTRYEEDSENHSWVSSTLRLAQGAYEVGARFIGVGTNLEHVVESQPTPYLASKIQTHMNLVANLPQSSFCWVRPFWIYSLVDKRPRVLREALRATLANKEFCPQDPERRLDFVDVRDVAQGFVHLIRGTPPEQQDLGSGMGHSVGEFLSYAGIKVRGREQQSPTTTRIADVRWFVDQGWTPKWTLAYFSRKEGL